MLAREGAHSALSLCAILLTLSIPLMMSSHAWRLGQSPTPAVAKIGLERGTFVVAPPRTRILALTTWLTVLD